MKDGRWKLGDVKNISGERPRNCKYPKMRESVILEEIKAGWFGWSFKLKDRNINV